MANIKVDEGAGPAVATDEVSGNHFQKNKIYFGADGTATTVDAGTPLPSYDKAVEEALEAANALLATIDADTGNLSTVVAKLTEIEEDTDHLAAIKTAGETLDNAISGSEVQVDVVGPLPAGNNNIGDVDVASIAAGSNLIGDVALGKRTSGGLSSFRSIDVDESEEEVKASAGQLYWIHFTNRAAGERFLRFYDGTAAEVTVGSTAQKLTFPLPEKSAGWVEIPQGFPFAKGITVAATTGIADNNTGAPAENDVVVNLGYA